MLSKSPLAISALLTIAEPMPKPTAPAFKKSLIFSSVTPPTAIKGMCERGALTAFKYAEQFGHQTVGTKVNISHLRACKVGTEVTVTAELTEVEGRRLEYTLKVEDSSGLLGEGTHQRYIIDPERFMAKLG